MMEWENGLRTIRFAPEIFLDTPVQVGDRHILSEEPAVPQRAGTMTPYLSLYAPPPYRAGIHLENPGDIACSQHGFIRPLITSHRHYQLRVATMRGLML